MNEKIKDLIAQAGTDVSGKWLSLYNAEALAELIVLECAGITLDYKNDDYYNGWCDHSAEILEHFGVKQ